MGDSEYCLLMRSSKAVGINCLYSWFGAVLLFSCGVDFIFRRFIAYWIFYFIFFSPPGLVVSYSEYKAVMINV